VIGVVSSGTGAHLPDGTSPNQGQGINSPDGKDEENHFAATFTPSNAAWIELHLHDFDGDGVDDDADNCYRAWNPAQENCNLDAENAAIARSETVRHRGDACDPVPCPEAEQGAMTDGAPTCPSPGVGQVTLCTGRATQNQVVITGHGPNPVISHATATNVLPLGMHLADRIDTSFRFCQINEHTSPPSRCRDAALMTNDQVTHWPDASSEPRQSPNFPYHRVTTRERVGGLEPPRSALPRRLRTTAFDIRVGLQS
jgi:hypothetical protein